MSPQAHEMIASLIDQLAEHERVSGTPLEFRGENGSVNVEEELRNVLRQEGL